MAKLRFAKAAAKVPKGHVATDIERLNALRNGLAHSFFLENLKKSKPVWKGKNTFTSVGFEVFIGDRQKYCTISGVFLLPT